MRASGWLLTFAATLLGGSCGTYAGDEFEFAIDPQNSGTSATIGATAATSGTLIGNYDQVNNPTGTRTKPGLWGSFGSTENLPVQVDRLDGQIDGIVETAATGTFLLTLDVPASLLELAELQADLLGGQLVHLPVEVVLQTESFRTRNPDSVYPGGAPFTIPIGEATLSALTIVQQGGPATGVLTPTAPNEYDFAVAPLVELTATIELLGQPLPTEPVVVAWPLTGHLVIQGNSAQLTALRELDVQNTQQPGLAIPQFQLDVPTILPPGEVAHLLFDLTLNETSLLLTGTSVIVADGRLLRVPGDLNCDGFVSFGDINPFVLALSNPAAYQAQYPHCNIMNADINGDGRVDFADINPFVRLLTNP